MQAYAFYLCFLLKSKKGMRPINKIEIPGLDGDEEKKSVASKNREAIAAPEVGSVDP